MQEPAKLPRPSEPADSRRRPVTRARAVFAFWLLVAMSLVSVAVAIWVTIEALAGRLSAYRLFDLIPVWVVCAGAIYLSWRLVRSARQRRKS